VTETILGQDHCMIDHLSLGVSDLARSNEFYTAVLAPLGYQRLFATERAVGYGLTGARDEAFAILPVGEQARPGRGSHLAFRAPNRQAVDSFHSIALQNGARDEGGPGLRPEKPYGPGYYAAFVLDPDGHRLEAVCHEVRD
jgi:catechol 2,3-dioxygenase-like lactoylglutathione lyase family enzyme